MHTLDKSWVPQGEGLVKGTLESVSENSSVRRAEVSSLQSILESSIRKVQIFPPPQSHGGTLITLGLTAILMFGVIPDKLYDFPKSILLPLAEGVTAPVTYFVYRGMRMSGRPLARIQVLRSSGGQVTLSQSAQRPSGTAATSHAQSAFVHRWRAVGRDRLTRVHHRLHRLLLHPHHRTHRDAIQISAEREHVFRLNVFTDSGQRMITARPTNSS